MADAPTPAPVQVFDSHYSQVVAVDPAKAAADPKRFQAVGDQKVTLIGPDGKPWEMPASSAADAVNRPEGQRWSWLPTDQAAHQAKVDWYRREEGGALATGVREGFNQLLSGVPEVLEGRGIGGHQVDPALKEALEAEKEAHPYARLGAGAIGLGINALATAGAGAALKGGTAATHGAQALEAAGQAGKLAGLEAGTQAVKTGIEAGAPGLLERMAVATARGASEGALYSAPQSVAQLAVGDYDKAAESLLWGAGAGGLVGLGHGAFTEALGAGQKALEAGRGKLLATAEKHGLVGEGGQLDLSKLAATPEKVAEMHGAAAKAIEEHASILDRHIADLPGKAAAEVPRAIPTELAEKVASTIAETKPGLLASIGHADAKRATAEAVDKLTALGSSPITFQELAGVRSEITKGALGSAERAQAVRAIDTVLEREQSRLMGQAYNKLPLKADYANYLADLGKMQQAMGAVNALSAPGVLQQALAKKMTGAIGSAVGSGIGGTIGGAIAGPAGAWMGAKAIAPLMAKITDHVLMPKALDLSGSLLRKVAGGGAGEWFGATLAKGATQAVDSKLAGIPRMFALKAAAQNRPDAVRSWLGPQATGLTKQQQFDRVTGALNRAAANPQGVQAEAAAFGQAFSHDPQLQQAIAAKQLATINYLASKVPRGPDPQPFQKAQWQPSEAQRSAFAAHLEVAHNPWAALDNAQRGTLRPEHVETLRALYPTLHAAMVSEVARMAHDPNAPLVSSGVRQQLSHLTGVPLDNPRGTNYQQIYQQSGPQQGGGGEKPKKKSQAKSKAPAVQTAAQRVEFK